ncbi:MAG: DUF5693 family protein [Oscillospiraceae bacterium]|nr:DUF5693 family protein [Oscillospiraceae bacterium]
MIKNRSVIWWLLLCCAVVCSAVLLFGRISVEESGHDICAAMQLDDLELLAEKSGLPVSEWQARLEKVGVRYFVDDIYTELPALPLVENRARDSLVLPEGIDVNTYDGPMVKTLYMYYKYGVRVIDNDPQEIEDLMFRAALDRGLRLIVLTPFYDDDNEIVSDITVYERCLTGLAERLEQRGLSYGEGFSCMSVAPVSKFLLLGAGVAPALLGAWLLSRIIRRKSWETPIALIAIVVLAALTVWNAYLTQKLMMFASAVLFPCVFAVWMKRFADNEPPQLGSRPVALSALAALIATTLWGIIGGLSVSALMSTREYMVGNVIFTGVKLALLAPLGFAGILLLIQLISEKLPRKKLIRTVLVCAAILCVAGAVMILRSGDVSSHAPGMDKVLAVRNWFEYTFYVRPRTKEMFAAVPCIIVFVWACRRKLPALRLLGGMGACLEAVSVTNTFCHAVAPITVSLIRTVLAVGIGAVVGFAAVGILELIYRAVNKKQNA